MSKLKIGLKQANILCNITQEERMDLIAEGLPIILKSAQGFWLAAKHLKDNRREADILEGFAKEEAAKILILMDIVRCPQNLIGSKIGMLAGLLYNHLARLLYAEAQQWKPVTVSRLRSYVDEQRKAHYVDGFAGEFILPNWSIATRESQLYADIAVYENEKPIWNEPISYSLGFPRYKPLALQIAESLSSIGGFDRQGLTAIAKVWGQIEFKSLESWSDSERLTTELLEQLYRENLYREQATQQNFNWLFGNWQMPMYNLDFSLIYVSLAELKSEQDSMLWAEVGYSN